MASATRPFTAGFWLLWVGAAALNEALLDGAMSLLDADLTAIVIFPVLGPLAVTLEWLVLRPVLPRLSWWCWFFANAAGGMMTLFDWIAVMLSGSSMTAGAAVEVIVMTLTMGAIGGAILAVTLQAAVGRFPRAFLACSIVAAFVVPLDVAIEQGPIHAALSSVAEDLSPLADWLREREFLFLPVRPIALLPDSHTLLVTAQALGRILANALAGAITGFGLWRLCRPARADRIARRDPARLARRGLLVLAPVVGLCLLFANRALPSLDHPPETEISTGVPIVGFAFESAAPTSDRGWSSLRAVAWSRDSRYAAAVYGDGTVRRLDVERQQAITEARLVPPPVALAFAADSRYLAAWLGNGPGTDSAIVLLDGRTLVELARASSEINGCRLLPEMMFGSDGALWVGCDYSGTGFFGKPLAIKLSVPGLAPDDVLHAQTLRGRDGSATSIALQGFFRGARDILVAEEQTGPPSDGSGDVRQKEATTQFLRVFDLSTGQDLVSPVELSRDGFNHTLQKAFLWSGGGKLTVPISWWRAAGGGAATVAERQPALLPYWIIDLRAASAASDDGRAGRPGGVIGVGQLRMPQRIEPFGLVVGTINQQRAGRIVVLDERSGIERQRIETVSQLIQSVSPDGRWLVGERLGRRDYGALRFYRVRP